MILVILAAVWVAVLLPPWLRGRREQRPGASISTFNRQLSTLERARPGMPATPRSVRAGVSTSRRLSRQQKIRRQQVLMGLLAAALLTLALAVSGGRIFLVAHLVTDVLLVAYVAVLARMRRMAQVRSATLRHLPVADTRVSSSWALQRASG